MYSERPNVTKIIPLHISGDKENVAKYRPVAIVAWISQIIEILIKNRLLISLKTKLSFHHAYMALEEINQWATL